MYYKNFKEVVDLCSRLDKKKELLSELHDVLITHKGEWPLHVDITCNKAYLDIPQDAKYQELTVNYIESLIAMIEIESKEIHDRLKDL